MQESGVQTDMAQDFAELQRRYRNVVSRSVAGMYRTTLEGVILECNDALAHMLGYDNADSLLQEKAPQLYYSTEERERFITDLKREGKLTNYEIQLRHQSGRTIHALENVYLDEEPEHISTIQGTIIDITVIKHAELEQRSLMHSYRSLVEHMHDGLFVVVNDRVVYANPAADAMVGGSVTGRTFLELFTPDQHRSLEQLIKSVEQVPMVGPVPVQMQGNELVLFAIQAFHEGERAVQVTLQDPTPQQALLREQMRVRMADEVNQVLREEIEQHRRTQEALRQSKRFARSLIDSSLDMIFAADPAGRITEYNPAAALRFGWEPEEIMGRDSSMLYFDQDEYHLVQRELDTHGMFSGEIRNITRSGEEFTSFLAASRLYDEDGRLLGVMGVSRDITRMKMDQEALRASEERYRDLFENATDLIQSVDADGGFQYVNEAWRRTLGYSSQEVDRMNIRDIIHPDHLGTCLEQFRRVMLGEEVGTVRTVFVSRDGREVIVEGSTNLRRVDGLSVATRSIFRDITKVHAADRQVARHEAKWRALFESSDNLFWTVDRDIKLTSYNKAYGDVIERLYGARPEVNTDPDKPRKLFAPSAYHAYWQEKYDLAFSGVTVRFETDLIDQQGVRVCNEIFLSPVFGPDGEVYEVFGVGHENTDQREAEDMVREQAARLQAIFDSSANMMIWTLDKDLRITSCNAHFQNTIRADFGIDMGVGDPFLAEASARAAGSNNDRYSDRYRAALAGIPQQFEAELTNMHGRTIWVENFLNPIVVDGEVQELSCQAYGITDRKEAQMELLRSLNEKEVLLKEVHHRVKNNLQIVSSIFSLQTAHVGDDKRILDLLRDSRDRIRSMSFIHESLYQNKDFSSVDMTDYMEGLGRNLMMSYSLSGKVSLDTDLQPVHLVLDQAIPCGLILNELISNALKHAFPDGRQGSIAMSLALQGDTVTIGLADDGVGVSPGFDPLRDANLGLELVHTLVEQLDGRLTTNTARGVAYLLTFERIK
jgi:PAS domain S-box-containing protein